MSNHNFRAVLLTALAALALGVAALAAAPQALAAVPTFTIVDDDGDATLDYRDSGGVIHNDVGTIQGTGSEAVAVDIPGATTTWNLAGPGAGTITVAGYSVVTFSGIGALAGGGGDDTFFFDSGSITRIDGAGGTNTLDYSSRSAGVLVNLGNLVATGTNGIGSIQNVIGGSGNDFLTGDDGDNVLTGGPGNDTINGGGGLDTVAETRDASLTLTNTHLTIGGEGDTLSGIETAHLTGGPGGNALNASYFTGRVVLEGAGGNDTLTGGPVNDLLIGGAGDDAMTGGMGDDEFRGGPGANTITEASTGGTDTVAESSEGDFALANTGLVWSEGSDNAGLGLSRIERFRLIGGQGDNDFSVSALAGGAIFVDGGVGFDTLTIDPHGAAVELITDGVIVPAFGQSTTYMAIEVLTVLGDTTAPVLNLPEAMTVEATSAAGAVVEFTATADDAVDGPLAVTCDPASGSIFPLGTTLVNCVAADASGNTAVGGFTVTVAVGWSGFIQPINADGSSIFKLGSTVPVKFALTGSSAGIADLTACFSYAKVSNGIVGEVAEAISTSAATSGNLFRYDSASGQYVFNWGTKGLTKGTYQLRIDLGDGIEHTVLASLK